MTKNIKAAAEAYGAYMSALNKLSLSELWELDQGNDYISFSLAQKENIIARMAYLCAEREDTNEIWDKYNNLCKSMKAEEARVFADNRDIIRTARIMSHEESEREAKAEFDSHDYYLPRDWLEEPEFYGEDDIDESSCPCLSREALDRALAGLRAENPLSNWDYATVLRWYFRPATEEEVKQRGAKD